MADASKISIGSCWVVYNGVNLGYTKGGVHVSFETRTREIIVDCVGEEPVAEVILGRRCMINVPLAQRNYAKYFSTAISKTISLDAGQNIKTKGHTLVLKTLDQLTTLATFKNVVPTGNTNMVFLYNLERIVTVQFRGYADEYGDICDLDFAT